MDLSVDDILLGRFVFGFADQLDEVAGLAGEHVGDLFVLEDRLHL